MLLTALISFGLFAIIFATYFILVIKSPKTSNYNQTIDEAMNLRLDPSELPKISILVPAWNEEKVIAAKLEDLAAMRYPREKMEVVLIDDFSDDFTSVIGARVMKRLRLPGKIVNNERRIGVNGCYNRGLQESNGDLIVTTDADVMVDHEALMKSVKILSALKDVGGVTARLVPVSSSSTAAARVEAPYRNLYNTMCVAESAIHSTFPGNGPFALVRRLVFAPVPVGYGSSDGNISLGVVRRGLRFVYTPSVFFYEPIPLILGEQIRQKTRRAARMIQSAWANRDMLFKRECGDFGAVVFPLRFLMMMVCPPLFLLGSVSIVAVIAYVSIYASLCVVLFALLGPFLGSRLKLGKASLLYSLGMHQCYLLLGLLLSCRKLSVWKPVERHSVSSRETPTAFKS